MAYRPVPLVRAPNDYAVQVDCPAGSHASLEGQRYELTTPATLSAAQLRAFEAVHRGNDRELQPLNGRPFR